MKKTIIFFLIALFSFALCSDAFAEKPCLVIKKITIAHCQKGPEGCEKCRKLYAEKYCLIDICPQGHAARRVTEVVIEGKKEWCEFDIIKQFEKVEDASAYARGNDIEIISAEDEKGMAVDKK